MAYSGPKFAEEKDQKKLTQEEYARQSVVPMVGDPSLLSVV